MGSEVSGHLTLNNRLYPADMALNGERHMVIEDIDVTVWHPISNIPTPGRKLLLRTDKGEVEGKCLSDITHAQDYRDEKSNRLNVTEWAYRDE